MKPILEYILSKDKKANPIAEYLVGNGKKLSKIDKLGEWLVVIPYGQDFTELEQTFSDSKIEDNYGKEPIVFLLHTEDALKIRKEKLDSSTTVRKIPEMYDSIEDFADAFVDGEVNCEDLEEVDDI